MTTVDVTPNKRPKLILQPESGWIPLNLRELWKARELLWFLALRDVKVRYKQTVLGAAWAVLQALMVMVVFDVLFTVLVGHDRKPTVEGIPYAISTFCGLLPWQLYASILSNSGNSLVSNSNLIQKIYFPRLILPVSTTLSALLDFCISLAVLVIMMFCYGLVPNWKIVFLPIFVLFAVVAALAFGVWIAALNVRFRDFKYVIPFIIQLGMFVSPVVYTSRKIPEEWRVLYFLNPMAGAIAGFRWCLLDRSLLEPGVVALSAVMTVVVFYGGLMFFRRNEQDFADIV